MATWDELKAKAVKILGDDAKVPDLPDNVKKASDDIDAKFADFAKSREDCEAKLLAKQNANDAFVNAVKQFGAKIEKSDFELDSSNKETLKKIQKARKLLTDGVQHVIKFVSDDDKVLDDLDKHLIQLGKYKQKSGPL